MADAAQDLAADLGHPVQVNAYVTPPQNRGFDDHYDVHDVFVVQVTGEKHWQVRPPVVESPLRDQPWTDRRDAVRLAAEGPPTIDAVLAPGDCLYVPRGWLHSATALGGTSIHLTMGVHVWTRRQLADDLLRAAGRGLDADPAVRAALELGVDPLDPRSPPASSPASGPPSPPPSSRSPTTSWPMPWPGGCGRRSGPSRSGRCASTRHPTTPTRSGGRVVTSPHAGTRAAATGSPPW